MGTIADKLSYLQETKALLFKYLADNGYAVTDSMTFREAVELMKAETADLEGTLPGRLLVWHDEFNGDTVNPNNWYFRTFGFDGIYGTSGATVHDGMLDLHLRKDADGSVTDCTMMMTNGRAEFKYGRIEAKMKFDKNCHVAFWCVGQKQTAYNGEIQGIPWPYAGEIDILEPENNSSVYSTLHWGSEHDSDDYVHDSKRAGSLSVDYTQWHTYAVEWTESIMAFYCDDTLIGKIENLETLTNPDGSKPFHEPFYIILQMMNNDYTVTGEYHAYVDWVRYYAPLNIWKLINVQSLTLSENTLGLNTGRVKELSLTMAPDYVTDNTLVWASDNEDVATFAGGNRVTAIGNGNANLTVTAKNGITATCALTVSDDVYNPVGNIELFGVEASKYYVGDSVQLGATVSPKWATHLEPIWKSSNASVAKVSASGLVEFVGVGSVTITANAADNSGVSASCQFTVESEITDNIQTDNCTVKLTKAGWSDSAWKADIPSGTTFDAATNKMTYVSGDGFYFDANGGKGIPFTQKFGFDAAYTVACRIKIPGSATLLNEARVIELTAAGATAGSANPRAYLGLHSNGNYTLRAYDASGGAAINRYSKASIFTPSENAQAINIIFVHGSDGSYKLFANGASVYSSTDSVQMPNTVCDVRMGGLGGMDNDIIFQAFAVYAEAMTDDKVGALNTALDEMYA